MATATVEVLTAEVRVLMVGSRQVTLSVFRQLDWCEANKMEIFGRVRDKATAMAEDMAEDILIVGRRLSDGALVRGMPPRLMDVDYSRGHLNFLKNRLRHITEGRFPTSTSATLQATRDEIAQQEAYINRQLAWNAWAKPAREAIEAMPLIVLAGLR